MTSIEHSTLEETTSEAMALLQKLIAIPSVSRDEEKAADLLDRNLQASFRIYLFSAEIYRKLQKVRLCFHFCTTCNSDFM